MGLFDSMFGGGKQEVNSEPWEDQQPHLRRGYRAARYGILDRPTFYYPRSTVGRFSPATRRALQAMMGRAMGGNALNPAAQQQTFDTLSGSYLTGPGMQSIQDSIISAVKPGVQGAFNAAGGANDPLENESLGRGVARGLAPFLDAERNRMMGASAMAPELAMADYNDMDRLMGAGNVWDDLYQRRLNDQVMRWNYAQQEPGNRVNQYMQAIGGAIPGSQTSSGGGPGWFNQLAGLGLAGAGIYGGFFRGPAAASTKPAL